jgi:hypothetical protein
MFPEFAGIVNVNKEMHIDILPRFRDAVRRKRPENWKTKLWFLPHDNAPTHRSDLAKNFLATTMESLVPADFYLFVGFKSSLNGQRFCDVTDIIKNATGELKRLSQNYFHKYLRYLYSGWQNYIVVQGHYFGGNVVLNDCPLMCFSDIK